jgi:hypothetical protein
MFPVYCGSPDTPYVRSVGERWLPAAVWRTLEPGHASRMDYMLTLKGQQGVGKTSFPGVLWGPENVFIRYTKETQHKDNVQLIASHRVYVVDDLDNMADWQVANMKGFLTAPSDTIRVPYGKVPQEFYRSTAVVATTNKDQFLAFDDSGNRRYPVVEVSQVRFKELAADRVQLWAEAVARYRQLKERGALMAYLSNIPGTTENSEKHVVVEDFIAEWDVLEEQVLADPIVFAGGKKDGVVYFKVSAVFGRLGIHNLPRQQKQLKDHLIKRGWKHRPKPWLIVDGKRIGNHYVREY